MAARRSPWARGARSETGYVRQANEDRMGWEHTAWGDVYVVSDGMGGYRGGALAAALTLRVLQQRLAALAPESGSIRAEVLAAFSAANDEVRSQRNPDDPETREMGATGVALITHGARALVAHVGDSRAYLWRRGAGLRRLTRDHTRVQAMQDAGLLTAEQAAVHPDASVLERAIGHKPSVEADVGEWLALEPGDLLLLCSDGLCGYVSDDEIAGVLRRTGDPVVATDQLVDCALAKGGPDNITVQLAGYRPPGTWRRGGPLGWIAVASGTVGLVALAAGGHWVQAHGWSWPGAAWLSRHAEAVARAAASGASASASGSGSAAASASAAAGASAPAAAAPSASVALPAPWPAEAASTVRPAAGSAASPRPTPAAPAASRAPQHTATVKPARTKAGNRPAASAPAAHGSASGPPVAPASAASAPRAGVATPGADTPRPDPPASASSP